MIKQSSSARVTLWIGRFIMLVLAGLIFLMPRLLTWYRMVRPLGEPGRIAILVAFYLCVPVVFWALRCLDKLLGNILREQIFTSDNVRLIRHIRLSCAVVGLICLPAAFFYPPLVFLFVIMVFLSLVVGVLENVMAAAVELREENDLTI